MSAYKDGKYAPRTEKIRAMATVPDSEDEKPDNSNLPIDIKNDYKISFYDEFNNTRLNLSKWNTKFIW